MQARAKHSMQGLELYVSRLINVTDGCLMSQN